MDKFADLDLGSTILSIAIAGGFVACGLLILRIATSGIKQLIIRLGLVKDEEGSKPILQQKKKGF